jgi:hypothetical protein
MGIGGCAERSRGKAVTRIALITDVGPRLVEDPVGDEPPLKETQEWVFWRPDRPSVAPQRSRQPRCSAIEPGTAV